MRTNVANRQKSRSRDINTAVYMYCESVARVYLCVVIARVFISEFICLWHLLRMNIHGIWLMTLI